MDSKIIAAYSGGTLPAAIGIVRLSGNGCLDILERLFQLKSKKKITECENNKLYYGKLLAKDGMPIDLCLVTIYRAPHSYTGEDMVEIFPHGSVAVVNAALEHAFQLGARPAEAGEFTKRAFLNQKLDLTLAEATADLIYANTERGAKNAANQLSGSVSGEVMQIRERLLEMTAHYYAVCDYPDEEIDPFAYEQAGGQLQQYAKRLQHLSETYKQGMVLKEGLPVAVIGRPNVGKSSLFNALSGFERAIVTAEAGTTRDVIEQQISCNGALIRMLDTAGLREAEGVAEKIGIEKAKAAAENAPVVLCVFDGAQPLTADDHLAMNTAQNKIKAAVINKSDQPLHVSIDDFAQFDRVLVLSAQTGEGIAELVQWLGAQSPKPDDTIITSARQAELMAQAAKSLLEAGKSAALGMTADAFLTDVELAIKQLGEITGEEASVDITAKIFSRFCVGK